MSAERRLTFGELCAFLGRLHGEDFEAKSVGARWAECYASYCTFRTPDGWTFRVFNDCGGWDWIDRITAPDGRSVSYDARPGEPMVIGEHPDTERWNAMVCEMLAAMPATWDFEESAASETSRHAR